MCESVAARREQSEESKRVFMAIEENKPADGATNNDNEQTQESANATPAPASDARANNSPTAAAPASAVEPTATEENQPTTPDASAPAAATEPAADEEEEARGASDSDFGAILEQYEQEQAEKANFQEGSVVPGKIIGINDRGVVIDFGFNSEGLVPLEEFMENGEVMVKRGDEVEVLIKSMESQEGQPVLSRADAVRMRAW